MFAIALTQNPFSFSSAVLYSSVLLTTQHTGHRFFLADIFIVRKTVLFTYSTSKPVFLYKQFINLL